MNSRRRISVLQRFADKPIAIRDTLEPVLIAAFDAVDGCAGRPAKGRRLHRTRHLFIRQQTAIINSIRAHLAEFGIVAPVGGVERLLVGADHA
jgi:hypothetical protein